MVFFYKYLYYEKNEPYIIGTQKNRLTERILFNNHNIGLNGQIKILGCEIFFLSRAILSDTCVVVSWMHILYVFIFVNDKWHQIANWPNKIELKL